MEEPASKVMKIAEKYLLPNASEVKEPFPKVLQIRGKVKFGKGYKKSTEFYATITPSNFLISVESKEDGRNFLKLLTRILGESSLIYIERACDGREIYTIQWIFPGFEDVNEIDLHRLFTMP